MNHPKSENVLKVIRNFGSILHIANRKNHLNMMQVGVNKDHICGTTHCHGGWYAVASKLHEKKEVCFLHGAAQMAKDLGFDNLFELQDWAKKNHEIWGNKNGGDMFCDKKGLLSSNKKTKWCRNSKTYC